jgi:YD repeat-containing protein
VRYSEIISITEAESSETQLTRDERRRLRKQRAADRLEQMNRDRIEMIANAVHRELRRGLVSGEYERHQLANILGN